MPSIHRTPVSAGIGLRLPHIEEAVATRPAAGWFEIHPENFVANPHATELLSDLARGKTVSVPDPRYKALMGLVKLTPRGLLGGVSSRTGRKYGPQ